MTSFKIKGKEYVINDYMSLGNYAKVYKIKDLFTDTYFAAKLVSIVTEAPLDELLKADYEEVNLVAAQILATLPLEKNIPFVDRFELDGVHYGFFPSWRELSFAEFVDMDTISTKPTNELLDLIHILAAIMYRPIINEAGEHNFIIEDYDVKTMTKRAELFKNKLDIKILLGAQLFFSKFERRYLAYSQASSISKIGMMKKLRIIWTLRKTIIGRIFKKRMDGFSSSTELLEMILQNTNTSTKKI
jgi:hypothetical protein